MRSVRHHDAAHLLEGAGLFRRAPDAGPVIRLSRTWTPPYARSPVTCALGYAADIEHAERWRRVAESMGIDGVEIESPASVADMPISSVDERPEDPRGASTQQPSQGREQKRHPFLLVGSGLLLGGLLMAALYHMRADRDPQRAAAGAPLVQLAAVELTADPLFITAAGSVRPAAEFILSSHTTGRVEYVNPDLKRGGSVREGEVMIRLDDEPLRGAVQQAEALVEQRALALLVAEQEAVVAEQELERLRERFDGDSELPLTPLTSRRRQVDAAKAALQGARAQLSEAERALEGAIIEAPLDGLVGRGDVEVGEYVRAGQRLATIHGTAAVEVNAELTRDQVALIPALWALLSGDVDQRIGAEVTASIDGSRFRWPGYVDGARLLEADQERAAEIIIRVHEPNAGAPLATDESTGEQQPRSLLLGMPVTVRIEAEQREAYFSVPEEALDDNVLWSLEDGDVPRLNRVPVDILQRSEDVAFVRSPALVEGMLVVTSDLPSPLDGMAVRAAASSGEQQIAASPARFP